MGLCTQRYDHKMILNSIIIAIIWVIKCNICVVRSLLVNTSVWQRARYLGNYIVYGY